MSPEVIDGIEIDLDQLDERLAELKPLIRRWARSDAIERELAIDAASTDELFDLWQTVRPRFAIIDAYLDDPHDTEARLLDNLTHATIQAAYEIERRTGTDLLAPS